MRVIHNLQLKTAENWLLKQMLHIGQGSVNKLMNLTSQEDPKSQTVVTVGRLKREFRIWKILGSYLGFKVAILTEGFQSVQENAETLPSNRPLPFISFPVYYSLNFP